MNGGGSEREGTGSRLWAVSTQPNAGLEPTNHEIMTWAEVGRLTDWATQAPQVFIDLNAWTRACIFFILVIWKYEFFWNKNFFFLIFFFNVYLFLRDRDWQSTSGEGRERRRQRIRSRLQALSCQHTAQCGAQTHKPWDYDLSRSWMLNWLSQPGACLLQMF